MVETLLRESVVSCSLFVTMPNVPSQASFILWQNLVDIGNDLRLEAIVFLQNLVYPASHEIEGSNHWWSV
jgi:hypothetical protein